jgi:hypothetical protein
MKPVSHACSSSAKNYTSHQKNGDDVFAEKQAKENKLAFARLV